MAKMDFMSIAKKGLIAWLVIGIVGFITAMFGVTASLATITTDFATNAGMTIVGILVTIFLSGFILDWVEGMKF